MAGSNCANHPEDEAALPAGLSRSGEGARRPLQLSDAAKRCVNTRPDVLLEPAVLLARAGTRCDGNKAVICERSDATRRAPGRAAEGNPDPRRLSRCFASVNQNSVVLSPHDRTEAPISDREPQKVKVNGAPDIRICLNLLKSQDFYFHFLAPDFHFLVPGFHFLAFGFEFLALGFQFLVSGAQQPVAASSARPAAPSSINKSSESAAKKCRE